LFRTVTDWAIRQLTEDEQLRGHSLSRLLTELTSSVTHRVTEAQAWYAGNLRNQIHHAPPQRTGRIAGDLHDQVGHSVIEGKLRLSSYLAVRDADPDRAQREIAEVGELLDASLATIRNRTGDLRTTRSPSASRSTATRACCRYRTVPRSS
jgi:signal transduction histidine kinase